MRLWLRLTLIMVVLTIVPLAVVAGLALRVTSDNATRGPELAMQREASTLATFVGMWVDGQARTLAGWQRVWDLDTADDDRRLGLLRATYKAMDDVVAVALVGPDGVPVVPTQFMLASQVTSGREPGSEQRVSLLLTNQPHELRSDGISVGRPYLPPDATYPVVPVVVGTRRDGVRLLAELSLAPIDRVFAGRSEAAAVLLDGFGNPVLGGDHPFVKGQDLQFVLGMGLDTSFFVGEGDDARQGAIYAVPYTDWKVLVFGPPSVTARVSRTIRTSTFWVGVLGVAIVALVGLAIERTLTRSVLTLREHAARVTEGDYALRNMVDRSDEIGDLARALNEMSQRLDTTSAEVRAYQTELEARVAARTSDLERAQAQLVRAGQVTAVVEMGAGLAHELNNPLAAILGQLQLLRAAGTVDDTSLERLEAQAARCRDVVATMQRLASGELDASAVTVVDLTATLQEAVAAARTSVVIRGVGLQVAPFSGPVAARIDAGVVRRALQQLLEAIAAGLKEGALVRVVVTPGVGRASELRVDTTAPVIGGDDVRAAGMRLWSARGLLEAAGAEVHAPDAGGTTWRVVFPEARWTGR